MASFKCSPAQKITGSEVRVRVVAVETPSRFYVHLPDPQGRRGHTLATYAATSLLHPEVHPILEEEVYPGGPVYVWYHNRMYRGVVTTDEDEDGDIEVWLGHWALALLAKQTELFTVPWSHRCVPFEAVACGLSGTRSKNGGKKWRPKKLILG